jgi:hypothetical protein
MVTWVTGTQQKTVSQLLTIHLSFVVRWWVPVEGSLWAVFTTIMAALVSW